MLRSKEDFALIIIIRLFTCCCGSFMMTFSLVVKMSGLTFHKRHGSHVIDASITRIANSAFWTCSHCSPAWNSLRFTAFTLQLSARSLVVLQCLLNLASTHSLQRQRQSMLTDITHAKFMGCEQASKCPISISHLQLLALSQHCEAWKTLPPFLLLVLWCPRSAAYKL